MEHGGPAEWQKEYCSSIDLLMNAWYVVKDVRYGCCAPCHFVSEIPHDCKFVRGALQVPRNAARMRQQSLEMVKCHVVVAATIYEAQHNKNVEASQ